MIKEFLVALAVQHSIIILDANCKLHVVHVSAVPHLYTVQHTVLMLAL
jgi:hypothetical protein